MAPSSCRDLTGSFYRLVCFRAFLWCAADITLCLFQALMVVVPLPLRYHIRPPPQDPRFQRSLFFTSPAAGIMAPENSIRRVRAAPLFGDLACAPTLATIFSHARVPFIIYARLPS